MLKYTTDELLATIRSRGMFPNSSALGTDDTTLIRLMNEEMMTLLLPGLMKIKEEFLAVVERQTLTSSRVRIPSRAIGARVRKLFHVDGAGSRTELLPIDSADLSQFNVLSDGIPRYFYLEGMYIVLLVGTPSGTLEVGYYLQPGQLVSTANARVVSSVDTSTRTITCTAPIGTLISNGDKIDVHSPYSGADIKLWNLTVSSVGGSQVQVDEEIDGSVFGTAAAEAGDYVALAGEAAIPALPRELHPVLAQAAVVRVLEALGDTEKLQSAKATLHEQLSAAGYLVDSRYEAQPIALVNRNSLWLSWAPRFEWGD